jgi:hypothetical protein
MLTRKLLLGLFFSLLVSSFMSGQHQDAKPPERDPQSLEILARAVQAAGGSQSLASVRDITEKGEIEFHWGSDVKGPVTIQMLGTNHFRLDYEVPGRKSALIVKDGFGFEQSEGKARAISHIRAVNLGNLTFPIAHSVAAIADPLTQISFVDIERQNGRSVYRVRLTGRLGLVTNGHSTQPVTKELIIDALTYDIVSVDDQPLFSPMERSNRARSHVAQRQIEYGDFRLVNGVRLPFSIKVRIVGQETMTILLNQTNFNSNLRDEDFGS